MIKILYIGYYPEHNFLEDIIYLNALKNKNYTIKQFVHRLNDPETSLINNDIIICGSFLQDINIIKILFKYIHKVIYNITEPIEFNNYIMYHLYIHKFINLAVGCVPENKTHIKFPLYIDPYEISSCEKINEINNYVKNIELNDLMIKKYCCLINRHDYGHTRTTIYNKLSELGFIICPSVLFNNYPNEDFEKIGRENFQKEFIFNICPENFVTQLDGYVTEKLFMACCCGNIPIYYGKLDDLDKQIFNLNRIILYDPTNDQSIDQVYTIIKKLLFNFQDLYNYYKQDVFLPSAIEIIKNYKVNLNKRLNEFIKNSSINYIDGKLN